MVKVMLDAGHYGKYNRSPANSTYYESDFTWKFHLLLKTELEKRGFQVGTTRNTKEKDLSLSRRGRAAAGYDLFISIHSNAVGSGVNNAVDYPVAITMLNDKKITIDESSKKAGEVLAEAVAICMNTKQAARTFTKKSSRDRDGNGIFDDEYYGVLNGAKQVGVAGIILEHSFHTNESATAWLLNDSNLQAMAIAEANALQKLYMPNSQVQPEVTTNWYRVRKTWDNVGSQIGAFKQYENAVNSCKSGYAIFDNEGNELFRKLEGKTHLVKPGDTLGVLARENNTTVQKIVAANKAKYPKITADFIRVGWILTIQ